MTEVQDKANAGSPFLSCGCLVVLAIPPAAVVFLMIIAHLRGLTLRASWEAGDFWGLLLIASPLLGLSALRVRRWRQRRGGQREGP